MIPGLVLLVLLVIWSIRVFARSRRPTAPEDVDRDELEEAEREVRDWEATVDPGDEPEGSDWGPGSGGR